MTKTNEKHKKLKKSKLIKNINLHPTEEASPDTPDMDVKGSVSLTTSVSTGGVVQGKLKKNNK